MKNIALILGAIIILGLIVLVLMPRSSTVPAPQPTIQTETPANDNGERTTPTSTTATGTTSAGDVGMEFPTTDDETTYDAIVTYTDAGFSPQNLTIARGDTVRFVNNSSQQMWVGADAHPTHTSYPVKGASDCLGSSFDQCAATGNGTSWDFTFTETGTWGYHNHRRARDAGSITVQ